jgi:hypothetical protein
MSSVFEKYHAEAYPFRFNGSLLVGTIAGGIPSDPKVAEGWLKTKLGIDKDDMIRTMVAETMVERGVTADEATEIVNTMKNLNGFKRDEQGLYVEGRQLKAALKEAISIAVAADKIEQRGWGKTNKWILGYFAEHVFVVEDRLHLGVSEATGINQRFVHTHRGTGIQYEEYVNDAKINFTMISDHDFTEKEWAMIWTCGEQNGLGASRSQGYGRYAVTRWDRTAFTVPKKSASSAKGKQLAPSAEDK